MLDWLLSKVNYFFWSSVVSGSLLIGTAFSPDWKNKVFSSIQSAHDVAKAKAPKFISEKIPELNLPKAAPKSANEEGVKKVSASSNEYIYNNKHYVLIQGKYYEARADNTYMVNGQKVYYVSNRENKAETTESHGSQVVDVKRGVAAGATGTSGLEMPTSPSEVMEALRKAQQQIVERNQQLEALDK